MESIQEIIDKNLCHRCSLSNDRALPIIYRGNINSKILLLGEAPGLVEEQQNLPFVGPAGQLLDNIFRSIGINTNKDLLLSNVLYCRPIAPYGSGKQNLTPTEEQLKLCRPNIQKFIQLIQPKIIIACGRIALTSILNNYRAKLKDYEGNWSNNIFTMTHPAAILHLSNWPDKQHEKKKQVWEYMKYFRNTYKDKLL